MNGSDDTLKQALQYALKLLSYRDRSESEILDKLKKKGYHEAEGKEVASYLKEKGYIDDSRYAEALKRSAIEQKQLGRRGVIHYLRSRGIPDEIIYDVSGSDMEYHEVAERFIIKKMKQLMGMDPDTIRRRLWSTLVRKGFSAEIIEKALRNCLDENNGQTN